MIRSLRSRLLLGVGLSSMLVLIASGVVLYSLISRALLNAFDTSLLESARTLAALVENDGSRIHSEMAEREMPQFARQARPDHYQLWRSDGTTLERSGRLVNGDLPRPSGGGGDSPRFVSAPLPDGRPGRIAAISFVPMMEAPDDDEEDSDGEDVANSTPRNQHSSVTAMAPVTLAIARDTIDLDRSISHIRWILSAVFAAAVIVALLTASLIVRIGLKPLRRSASQIAGIDGGSLSTRLDATSAPTEVRKVVERLNGLLTRLDDAFQHERAFSANVAHELRTPLAGLRSTIEVALSQPRQSTEYERALAECLAICHSTESLTENLLVLARLDTGQCQLQRESVATDQVLRTAWAPLAASAESKRLNVIWQNHGDGRLETDPALLSLIARNLLENAVCYADAGGQIEIGASAEHGHVRFTIKNTATGLPDGLAQNAFKRFWRSDTSRTDTGQHAGVGLSLCWEAARTIGGELMVSTDGDSFTACLRVAT